MKRDGFYSSRKIVLMFGEMLGFGTRFFWIFDSPSYLFYPKNRLKEKDLTLKDKHCTCVCVFIYIRMCVCVCMFVCVYRCIHIKSVVSYRPNKVTTEKRNPTLNLNS